MIGDMSIKTNFKYHLIAALACHYWTWTYLGSSYSFFLLLSCFYWCSPSFYSSTLFYVFYWIYSSFNACFSPYSSDSCSSSGINTAYFSSYAFLGTGGAVLGGAGFAFLLVSFTKFSFNKYFPFTPHLLSLTSIGRPNSKSNVHTWHKFLSLLHELHKHVLL